MTTQYKTPTVPAEWADKRSTHEAVAMAIHAIADNTRPADDIWEAPTPAEVEHVAMAIHSYIEAGIFDAEDDGEYLWGDETVGVHKNIIS